MIHFFFFAGKLEVTENNAISYHELDLNQWSSPYEGVALPLSYRGISPK